MSVALRFLDDPFFAAGFALSELRDERREAVEAATPAGPAGLPIALLGVSKAYGSRVVLDGLDLSIAAGEFVAVVGRSGGGKSTLLRLIAGLERPTGGTLRIGDRPIDGTQDAIRLMFQDARLLPWQRVLSNVGIARGSDWQARARAALAAVGLADRAGEWPSVLSGGQRQRVALARALVDRPGILLLDEPFGALDALTRVEMHQLLEGLFRERGFTALLITHDVAEAVALADRVLVLRDHGVALDLKIPLPRPRRELRDPAAAELQARILEHV